MLASMFAVTEAEAATIRQAFERDGEFSAAMELRRLFPAITDLAQARQCARVIASWQPLPAGTGRLHARSSQEHAMKKQKHRRKLKAPESKAQRKVRVARNAEQLLRDEHRQFEASVTARREMLHALFGENPTGEQEHALELLTDYHISQEEAEAYACRQTELLEQHRAAMKAELGVETLTEAEEDEVFHRADAELPIPPEWKIRTPDEPFTVPSVTSTESPSPA